MRYLFCILFLLPCCLSAQKAPEPINSVEIYKTAIGYIQDEKYKEALSELEKVDRNDTNYAEVLLKKISVNLLLEKYDEAVKGCKEGIELNSSETYNFYINHAVVLMRAKKLAEAIVIMDDAMKKYPRNYLLRYNKGVACKELGRIEEAAELYKEAIRLNPYYAKSHLNLGLIAFDEGKISQAVLSL